MEVWGDDEGQSRSFTEVGGCNRCDMAETEIYIRKVFERESGNACLRTEQAASLFFLEDNHHNDLHEHALVDIPGSNL